MQSVLSLLTNMRLCISVIFNQQINKNIEKIQLERKDNYRHRKLQNNIN